MDSRTDHKGTRAAFLVREISCTTCAIAIEKRVKKLEGVKDVKTSVMLNKVFVDYDPSKVGLDEIKKEVNKTGYGAYLTLSRR